MIKIALDCFGGDNSPDANIDGALMAIEKFRGLHIILTGDEAQIRERLNGRVYPEKCISVVHAPEVITCNDKPTDAIRLKRESSMMKAVKLLREEDDICGMVSTGSTGALVAASMLRVGRLKGVIRPAFCPVLPTMNGGVIGVCDSGANVDITPDYLQQYAVMGSIYLEKVFGVEKPRVGLLNIGAEAEKGDELRKKSYELLCGTKGINFAGNMEARELLSGDFDLVVCDGFSGNVLVKATEGACLEMLKKLKRDIMSKFINKLGALFMRKMFAEEKEFMNYQNYGGSVLLGTSKVVVKGHGSSDAVAVCACIGQAYRMEQGRFSVDAEAALAALNETEI